jgi:hypothetical protein
MENLDKFLLLTIFYSFYTNNSFFLYSVMRADLFWLKLGCYYSLELMKKAIYSFWKILCELTLCSWDPSEKPQNYTSDTDCVMVQNKHWLARQIYEQKRQEKKPSLHCQLLCRTFLQSTENRNKFSTTFCNTVFTCFFLLCLYGMWESNHASFGRKNCT